MPRTGPEYSRRVLEGLVGVVVVLVLVAGGIILTIRWRIAHPPDYRLPDPADISAIVVVGVYDGVERPNDGRFDLPEEYIGDVISCFEPYYRCGPSVPSYLGAGALEISCRNGERLDVHYYHAVKGNDAFSVAPVGHVGRRTYYLRVDIERLGEVIERARVH
jgi:hypothetical protein